ncbi:MAG TPA: RNA polymerase sigma factor [Chitinophagaceae bacterium]|nr:RNA polymerase sigma factor [Chitinophagaceae bacterium]
MSTQDFDVLLVQNSGFLRPIAVSLTRDTDNANNLVQETLYRALSNRDKYLPHSNIRAWLSTIMRNIFINDYRRKSRQKTVFDNSHDEYAVYKQHSGISNAAESNIQVREIKAAISKLPELFKTPFLLYFEGYKYNEIADLLNEPLGTVKSRIHFARKSLKEQITKR